MTADSNGYVGFGGFRNAPVVIGGTSYTPPNPMDLNSCWGELIARGSSVGTIASIICRDGS